MAKNANLALVGEALIPSVVLVQGRGQTGKSSLIRLLYELVTARGGDMVLCDVDRTNQSLSSYPHLQASITRPVSAEDNDVTNYLNDTIDRVIENRRSAAIDMGGGDLMLKGWSRDLELASFLEGHGVRPVSVILISPDPDGLAYLDDIEQHARFQPASTVLVLNEGTVLPGRSVAAAFEPILRDEIFQAALKRGAQMVRLTRLGPMPDVNRLRVSFTEAATGAVLDGKARLGPTARQLVTLWLRQNTASLAPVLAWM